MMVQANLTPAAPTPNKINSTVLGFLAGLAIKGGLDTICKTIPDARNLHEVWSNVGLIPLLLFLIFFITILRFLYGAYRFQEEEYSAAEWWVPILNVLGALVLFVFFYISGLSVKHPYPFFLFLLFVHLTDFLWFFAARRSKGVSSKLRKVMTYFINVDMCTFVSLFLLIMVARGHWFTNDWFVGIGAAIMIILAIVDVKVNFTFFFHPAIWRSTQ